MNPQGPRGPADFLAIYGFRRPCGTARVARAFRVCGLDYPFAVRAECAFGVFRRCPSSLYTFPVRGLARDYQSKGFPEFEQFYVAGFPARTQVGLESAASASSATPAWPRLLALTSPVAATEWNYVRSVCPFLADFFFFWRMMLMAAASIWFLMWLA